MTLTVADLHETLADSRHNGWGYATAGTLPESKQDRLDRAVVRVANELGLTYEELFVWSDSKDARWLADDVHGRPANAEAVRDYLNRTVIDNLVAECKRYATYGEEL